MKDHCKKFSIADLPNDLKGKLKDGAKIFTYGSSFGKKMTTKIKN